MKHSGIAMQVHLAGHASQYPVVSMHIYAISNQKGGVGKTTTAVNLARGLAPSDHRTLLLGHDNLGPDVQQVCRTFRPSPQQFQASAPAQIRRYFQVAREPSDIRGLSVATRKTGKEQINTEE